MDEDKKYKKIVDDFYDTYTPLRRRYSLRLHSSFDIFGNNMIEIWKYSGEKKVKRILKVEEDTSAECYIKATEILKQYREETAKREKRAG